MKNQVLQEATTIIQDILHHHQRSAFQHAHHMMIHSFWQISTVLATLSEAETETAFRYLNHAYPTLFDEKIEPYIRQFHKITAFSKSLSWEHYKAILDITDDLKRNQKLISMIRKPGKVEQPLASQDARTMSIALLETITFLQGNV